MSWNDFNSAEEQKNFDPIPSGTLVKVRMTIKPGGHDDQSQGWTGGYATRNVTSGAVYLNCEFTVLEGEFAKRKIWNLIGLYSSKGPEYGNMGRSFIKGILNSARNLNPKDNTPQAQNARRINGLGDLDSIVFVGRISVGKDQYRNPKNEITLAVTPEHKDYAAIMGANPNAAPGANQASAAAGAAPNSRPSWAQ